jgi:hypothetical protein
MLKQRLASKDKSNRAVLALESVLSNNTSVKKISVKSKVTNSDERNDKHLFSLDGVKNQQLLEAYPFLNKTTKPDVMSMDEIAEFENTALPKEAIRKLVADAQKRRQKMSIYDSEMCDLSNKKPV